MNSFPSLWRLFRLLPLERHENVFAAGGGSEFGGAFLAWLGKAQLASLFTEFVDWRFVVFVQSSVVPFADSEELVSKSGATLIEVGSNHRRADPEPLEAMLKACERINSK